MAAGDRYANGKPKDIVMHFGLMNIPACGQKGYGYVSSIHSETTCKKCLKKYPHQ